MITVQTGMYSNAEITSGPSTYYGLSTDTKPTVAYNGSCYIEMDTSKLYFYNQDATSWVEWGA